MSASVGHIDTGTVSVGGREIFFRHAGKGDPLILLHGSHRSSYLWTRNIPGLSAQFSVYALDWPGYGHSDPIGRNDPLPDMVQVGHDFLHALGYSRASWIGESRGGGIAIQLATRFREAVDRLVLVDSVGLPPNELPKPPEMGSRPKWEWFCERSFDDPSIVNDELRDMVIANLEKAAVYEERRLAATAPEYNRKGLLEDMVRIDCPTLLVWGRQDPVFPVECAERFQQLIPTLVDVIFIDNARHMPHFEHPEIFNHAVLTFLLGNIRPSSDAVVAQTLPFG